MLTDAADRRRAHGADVCWLRVRQIDPPAYVRTI